MNSIIVPGLFFLAICLRATAQVMETRDQEVDRIVDDLLSQQDLDLNYEELYESILLRLSSPIDINKATSEELRSIFILSETQIKDLLSHRAMYGDLLSHHELQSIPSFNVELIRRLLPLITVESSISARQLIRRVLTEKNNYLVMRYERAVESKAGFTSVDSTSRFKGSPDKMYMRFRVSHPGDFSLGFTFEKDPGELSLADYFSFHTQVANKGRLTNLVIGDFQAQFGQGLVMGGGFGMGKGSETVLSVRRNSLGLLPYTSVRESGHFRGIATTISLARPLAVHAFGSMTQPDASVVTGSSGPYITSFPSSGLHRNEREAQGMNVGDERTAGTVIEFTRRAVQAGATFMTTWWDIPVQPAPTLYNQFDFTGNRLANAGLYASCTIANFNLFAEGAQTLNHGYGLVAGMLGSLSRNFDMSILARKYARDFQSLYSNALAESSSPQNESGLYVGWKHQASRSVAFSGYVDMFTFPWLRYRSYSTRSDGHEFLFRLMWKPSKSTSLFVQAKEEQKDRNLATVMYKTATVTRRNYCINADYSLGPIGLKTRVQFSTVNFGDRSAGFVLAQDVSYEWRRWALYLRHALFDTDNFDNRQYMYEPDMWLAYSFPAYDGTGIRSIVMLRQKFSKHLDIWVRWSRSHYYRTEATGSGVDLVNGPSRNDLKVQIRVRL